MKQSTKQRIVGTVVLLALALIFLPIIFDGEGSYQRPISSRIPEPPILQVMPDPVPQRPVIQADSITTVTPPLDNNETAPEPAAGVNIATNVTNNAPAATATDQSVTTTEPSIDERGLPIGWSVRLGSFSNITNARNLNQKLLAAGYRAYSRELNTDQGKLTAVYVGPQVEKGKADQLKQQLQTEFQLSGIVVRFEVDTP